MPRSKVIGIDASRLSVERLTGTETYTFELIKALAELETDQEFRLYLNAETPPDRLPKVGEAICIPFPRLWTHGRLSFEMIRNRPGLLFVPAHVIPVSHPRSVVTIHDLGYLEHPEAHPAADLRMLDWSTRWSIRAASKIIAISQLTKDDLIRHYRVDAGKIEVIHHGVSKELRPASPEDIARVRRELFLPDRFVLAVGTVQPRKNLARLAAAVASLNAQGTSIQLVIAGKRGWMADEVEAEIEVANSTKFVTFLGYVNDIDLPALYSASEVFCQPSLYEGFGMPVLEAMACGTPVVAANRSSLPEIGGNAAEYFDPISVEEITASLSRVINESSRRKSLIERGFRRAEAFSWHATAEKTLMLLQRQLNAK